MKWRYGRWTMGVGAAVVALCFATAALAECGISIPKVHPSAWTEPQGAARLLRTVGGGHDGDGEGAPIVGMWHVTFTAKTMNGAPIPNTVVDNALVVWHSDGTEIMNSARPPQDGNFCMGVWEQVGRFTYKLNHFAWGANAFPTDPPTAIGPAAGPTHITERVILGPDGRSFSGTFTLDAYDTSGNVATSFTGTISGSRITLQTTVGDLL